MSAVQEPPKGPSKDESIDLASVGRRDAPEVTIEASDLMTGLPMWVSRGLLYIIGGFVLVSVVWASFAPMDAVAEGRGSVIPEGEVRPLQTLESGTVRSVMVQPGDSVIAGQALIQLDDSLLLAKQKQAQLELEGAQVNLISLRNSGADVGAIVSAESRITDARNNLDAANQSLNRARITAPVSGTVTDLKVHGAGAVVQEGTVVATIAPQGARLVAEVLIPNEQIANVRPGLNAKLLIDAFPYQHYGVFDGKVLSVSPDSIPGEGGSVYRAIVLPDATKLGSGALLKPGLSLSARIVTERRTALALFLDPFRSARNEQESRLAVLKLEGSS